MSKAYERVPYWDNLKGLLILLVVCGHILAQFPNGKSHPLYKLIYLFHMPLFVFCSGYFAQPSVKKIIKALIIPYVLVQIICCLLAEQDIQFLTPCWGLWYLPSLAVWRSSVFLLERCRRNFLPFVLAMSFLVAIGIGFADDIGRTGSLSRIVVYFPFFVLGYYARVLHFSDRTVRQLEHTYPNIRRHVFIALLILFSLSLYAAPLFESSWLYESQSYAVGGYCWLHRAAHNAAAVLIGGCILILTPKRRTILTVLGSHSLWIYILHIVIILIIQKLLII